MKWLTLALAALFVLIQYPLWLGNGGWLRVGEVDQQIRAQREGIEAIEERARSELGMVRQDEIFFQLLDEPARVPGAAR